MKKLIQASLKMHLRTLFFVWLMLFGFSFLVFLEDVEMNTVYYFVFTLYNFLVFYLLILSRVNSQEEMVFACLPIRKRDRILCNYCMGAGIYMFNSLTVLVPNLFSTICLGRMWIVPLEMLFLGWGIQAIIIVGLVYLAKKDSSKIVYMSGLFVVIIGLQKLDGFQHITWPVAIGAAVLGSFVFVASVIRDLRRVDYA